VPLAGEDRVKLQSLQDSIAPDLLAFEEEYERLLSGELALVTEICDHLKRGRGKRFRPTLLLVVAKHDDAVDPDAVFSAACVELVHTATLIHDDFIDEAETRRNLPSVNARWGASAALIMGDFLYSKVFALLTGMGRNEELKILARTTHSMSIAEALQLERNARLDMPEEDYLTVIHRKTASLIEAACEMGALANPRLLEHRETLAQYGRAVGMAFQITDDIFDYAGDDQRLGKPVGGDWREGRITLPFIAAWAHAPQAERDRIQEASQAANGDGTTQAALWPEVRAFVQRHGGVDHAYEMAQSYGRRARELADQLGPVPQREILTTAADYVLVRLH